MRTPRLLACLLLCLPAGACSDDSEGAEPVPQAAPGHLDHRIEQAALGAGGLRWRKQSEDGEGVDYVRTAAGLRSAAGTTGAGEPFQVLDLGDELCFRGRPWEDDVHSWPRTAAEWRCLPDHHWFWSSVHVSETLRDPGTYAVGLDETAAPVEPRRETRDGVELVRHGFDDHLVWLDEDHLPRRIERRRPGQPTLTWTVEPAPGADVAVPPADERSYGEPELTR